MTAGVLDLRDFDETPAPTGTAAPAPAPEFKAVGTLDLSSFDAEGDYLAPIKPEPGVSWGDYGQAALSGVHGLTGSVAGMAQYVTGADENSSLARARRYSEAGARDAVEAMSPQARRNLTAEMLPNEAGTDVWDGDVGMASSLGLKITASLPGMAATMIPGGLVGRAAMAAGAGARVAGGAAFGTQAVIGGAQMGGQVFNDIIKGIMEMPDAELQAQSPGYAYLRSNGASEFDARQAVADEAVGSKPMLMAAIGGAMEKFGAGGAVTSAVTGGVGRGIAKGAVRTAGEEAATEAAQNALQEGLTQTGKIASGEMKGYDPRAVANNVIEGAVLGAAMGGATGAVTGGLNRGTKAVIAETDDATTAAIAAHTGEDAPVPTEQAAPVPEPVVPSPREVAAQGLADTGEMIAALTPGEQAVATSKRRTRTKRGTKAVVVEGVSEAERAALAPVVEETVAPVAEPQAIPEPLPDSDGFEYDPDAELPVVAPVPVVPEVTQEVAPAPEPVVEEPATAPLTPEPVAVTDAASPSSASSGGEPPVSGRVLRAQTPEAIAAEKQWRDQNKAVDRENAKADGTYAPGQGRTRDRNFLRPEVIEAEGTIQPFMRRAQAAVTEEGEAAPAYYREALAAQEGIKGKKGDARLPFQTTLDASRAAEITAAKAQAAEREAAAAKAVTASDTGVFDDAAAAPQTKRQLERTQKAAVLAEENEKARAAIFSVEPTKTEERALIGTQSGKDAIKARLTAILANAEAAGIVVPERASATTPPFLRELTNLKTVVRRIDEGKFPPAAAKEFFTSHTLARAGETKLARTTREDENNARFAGGPAEGTETRAETGTGDALVDTAPTPEQALEQSQTPEDTLAADETPEARERPKVEVAPDAVVAGANRAGTFAMETRGRRKFTPPGKAAAPKAGLAASVSQLRTQVQAKVAPQATPKASLRPRAPENATTERQRLLRELAELDALEFANEPDAGPRPDRVYDKRTAQYFSPKSTETLGEAFARADLKSLGGINAEMSPFLAKRIREVAGDTPVHVVSGLDMVALTQDLIDSGAYRDVPLGYYEPNIRAIVLRDDAVLRPEGLAHLLLHEGTHAALMDVLDNDAGAYTLVDTMRRFVLDRVPEASTHYGTQDAHEFMSEALSNRAFQELLAGIKAPPSLTKGLGHLGNVWEFFVARVRSWLGMPRGTESMLDASLRVGASLMSLREAPIEMRAPRALVTPKVTEPLADVTNAGRGKLFRFAVVAQTLDQLGQNFSQQFSYIGSDGRPGSHLADIVRNMQRVNPFVQAEAKTGLEHARRFLELKKANPAAAEASARLRADVTMANVIVLNRAGPVSEDELLAANEHLGKDAAKGWQAKAHLLKMQRDFEKLPSDVRAQMLAEGDYYRGVQNKITRKLIENILDVHSRKDGTELSRAERADIAAKTYAGTLNEEDRAVVGNDTVFKSLQQAKELQVIKGLYYPQMRHGDFVVTTRSPIGDTMGGKEISPGVVEFRAPKDKDARAAAKKFSGKTELAVTRQSKVYYSRETGAVLRAQDAVGEDVDVGYRVAVQTQGTHFFDTEADAQAFRRENPNSSEVMVKENREAQGDLTGSQLASLMASIDQRGDLSAQDKALLRTAMAQGAVRLMTGNRIQSRSLPRRKVQGASLDYGRNMTRYATAASGYLGKLTYMPAVRESLSAMREIDKTQRMLPGAGTRNAVLQEVEKRLNANQTDGGSLGKAMQDLMVISQFSKLLGPSYSIINSMQVGMVTYPILAGRFGGARTGIEITKAYNAVGGLGTVGRGLGNTGRAVTGWGNPGIDGFDVAGNVAANLAKAPDGKELTRMWEALRERGAIDDEAQFEVSAAVATGRGKFGTVLAKVDRIGRQLPGAVEVMNRGVSAVAAYRLARKTMAPEAAIEFARTTVMNSQGDYSAVNAPRAFNNPVLKPFFQFKKYAQLMSYNMASMAHTAFAGASPAERKVARRQVMHLMAVQVATAGALGLPGLELVKLGFLVAGAFGLGGGWDDFERYLRKTANESLGKDWSDMVMKGVASRAMGIDLSGRLSLADMWLFNPPTDFSSAAITGFVGQQVLGAPGMTAIDMQQALKAAGQGDFETALVKGFPIKWGADMAKAYRGYSTRGDMTGGEAMLLGGLGLRTGRLANQSEELGASIEERRQRNSQRTQLGNAYLAARTPGDRARVMSQIRTFNKTATGMSRVNTKSLDKRRAANDKRRRELQD